MNARNRMFCLLVAVIVSIVLWTVFPGLVAAKEDSGGGEPATVTPVSSDAAGGDIAPVVVPDAGGGGDPLTSAVEEPTDDSGKGKDNDKKPDEPDPDEELAPETLNAVASGGAGGGAEGGVYSIPTAVDSVYTGAAVYNIPIIVPPGRKGVQPSLALTYNSYTSNGWIGVGWDLEIGSIERSTKRGMDYSANDYVSTQGGELVARSDWGTNYYGAKVEGAFSKYYFNSSTSGWEVTAKDGTKYYYGSTSASRLDNGLGNFKWCLDKVLDTNSNYMTVSFTKDNGQIYPAQINYTGNTGLSSTKSVVFTLEDRTDTILSYKSKTQQKTVKRLSTISTYAGGALARQYVLTYAYSYRDGFSQVTQVQTKGAASETTVQPEAFTYYAGTYLASTQYAVPDMQCIGGCSTKILFGDINGDGYQDFIRVFTDYYATTPWVQPYISDGDGTFGQGHGFQLWANESMTSAQLGDVDGDGCADFVTSYSGSIYVYRSLGTGYFSSYISTGRQSGYNFQLADINGDGLKDLVTKRYCSGTTYGKVYSNLADGSGSIFSSSESSHFLCHPISYQAMFADMNGDGMDDLIHYSSGSYTTFLSLGDGSFSTSSVSFPGSPSVVCIGDINGDGIADLITVQGPYQEIRSFINTGSGQFTSGTTIGWGNSWLPVTLADVTGDGLADIIAKSTSYGQYSYIRSKGDGTFGSGGNLSSGSDEIYLADVNGDGAADFLNVVDNDMLLNATVSDGPGNYLQTATNPLRGTTTVTYANSSIYPDNFCPFILHPVSQIVTNDLTVNSTTQYSYEGATYDDESREFWGFEKVKKTNPDGSTVETSYLQTPYLKGRIDLGETRTPTGTLLKRTDLTWDTYPASPTTYGFARLVQQHTEFENNPSLYSQEAYTYDNTNGNTLTIVTTGTNAETITKTNSYVNKGTWVWRPYQEAMSGSVSGLIRQTDYTYSAATGNLLTATYYNDSGSDPVVSMTYDGFGNVASVTDAESNITYTTYDATYTYPVTITLPATGGISHETEQVWDNRFGKIVTSTDQNGFDTDYSYDGYGRLTQVDYPDGGQLLYTYYDTATPKRYVKKQVKESSSSYVDSYAYYDGLGRVIETMAFGVGGTNGMTIKNIYARAHYDAMGRNYKNIGPGFVVKWPISETTSYDYLSRPLQFRTDDASGGPVYTTYSYSGFSTTVTDPDGNLKTQTTDHLGRIIKVEEQYDGSIYTTTYDYNAAGDLLEVTDASGNATTYTYDTLGRKKTMNDPDMGYWQYMYDGNGNLLTQTDAKNQVITFTYDELNRVTSKTYSPSNPMVWYFYDSGTNGIGLPYQVVNANATTTYNSFDSMGRSTSVTKTISGDSARTTQYTYDLSGKVLRTTYPDGYYVTNAYYAGTNLLGTVTGSDGVVHSTMSHYHPTGKIGKLTQGNGTVTTYTYNSYNIQLTDIVTVKESTTLQSRHYTYFGSGDIDTVTDNVAGVTYDYTYDDLHRLTDETNNGGYGAMHVAYNAIGNITQKSVGSNTFYIGYDSSHKHAVDYVNYNNTNYDYTYDANGNMTQGYDFSNLSNIRLRTIAYNVDNMPASIVHGSGTTAALLYDGAGARAKKTVTGGTASTTYYIGNHFEVKNGVATKFFFAGNLRVAQMVGSTVSYFHKDHLGSSTVMTNSSGTLLESTNFEPFGGQRAHTGTDTSAYKFTDQEFDAENGLYNYDARMYDPVIGRFISPDNIIPQPFNPQSLNRYSYCLNNPLIYTDPTGHEWMLAEVVCHAYGYGGVDWFGLLGGPFYQQCPGTWGLMYGALFSQFYAYNGGGGGGGGVAEVAGSGQRNLLSKESDEYKKWSRVPIQNGKYQIIGHGNDIGNLIDEKNLPISVKQLKTMIENDWTPGTPIDLLACYAGKTRSDGELPYAKSLAIELGVEVRASNGIAVPRDNGTYGFFHPFVDDSGKTHDGIPDLSNKAEFITFTPDPEEYP